MITDHITEDRLERTIQAVIEAEEALAVAKDEYKEAIAAAFEDHDLTGNQIKAIMTVAKAKLKGDVKTVSDHASEVLSVAETVQ